MGLFSQDVPVDDRLAGFIRPRDKYANKQVAKNQGAILSALSSGQCGSLVLVGVSGSATVAVITDKTLLVFRGGQLKQQVNLRDVSEATLTKESDYWVHARAKPGLDFTFRTFEDGNAFLVKLDRRDIPKLYPQYFERILHALGYSSDAENMLRLIQRVAQMIWAGGANAYFAQTQEEEGHRAFERRFEGDHPYEQWLSIPDDMIDFLWEWNANFHPPLRGLIAETERLLSRADDLRGHDKLPSMEEYRRNRPGS
jgi:hypothetical protein